MDPRTISTAEATQALRLFREVLSDLHAGRDEEVQHKLQRSLNGDLELLPNQLAEETSNRLASALGALVGPERDERHAVEMMRELVEVYTRYVQ